MSFTNSALLGLIEPVTGTESGVWGDDVNLGLTSYVDIAIAGTNNITVNTDVTLTITTGTYAGSGITSSTAQYAILNCTGARTAVRYINAPNSSKIYSVINNTTGGFNIIVRGSTGPTSGVTILNGERCIIAWDTVANDYVKLASDTVVGLIGTLPVSNGGTGATTLSGLVYGNGTATMTAATAAQIVAAIGSTPVAIATTAATATTATSATTATTATNIANGVANQLVYQTGVGATGFVTTPTTSGTVLGWNGTSFGWVSAPAASSATNLAGGGAYTVVYQSTAGVTAYLANGTTGQALVATTGGAPSWGAVGFATNLAGGAAFQVPYQTAPNTTAFSSNFQFNGAYLTVGNTTPLSGATNPTFVATGSSNNYVQSYIYNANTGVSASADLVAYADNSTDAHGWADIGFTSSVYADTTYTVTGPNEAYVFGSAPSGSGKTGNLVYATDSTGTANAHQWYVGGFTQAKSAYKMQLTATELTLATPFKVNGSAGTSGYVLTSTGTSTPPTWVSPTTIGTSPGKLYFYGQF